jgi:hypothetical protein
MKRAEINAIAEKLVKYVEENPNCTRGEADRSIDAGLSTVVAWESIKHLFDYKRYSGKKVTYKRNKLPYKREVYKRIYDKDSAPASAIVELSQKMKVLIDENYGITGAELRDALDVNVSTFKRASRLLDVDRQRSYARGMSYYPKGTKPAQIKIEKAPVLKFKLVKFAEMAKTNLPIITQWRTALPWEARV